MLRYKGKDVEWSIGNGDCSSLDQLLHLVITPAGADAARSGRHGHRHIKARVANDDRGFRPSASLGDRLKHHRRMRLGRMPVRRLQRDEARVDIMEIEAM